MSKINERIKERRQQLGLTLLEVAEALGVKEATAQRYESGAIKNRSHETICKLSSLLHCSPSYLMGWEDPVAPAAAFSLSDLEKQIVIRFRALPDGEKNMLLRSLGIEEKGEASGKSARDAG